MEISELSSLKLAANRLETVPLGLATMSKLEELQLYGNNFSSDKNGTVSINSNATGRLAVRELQSRIMDLHASS